MFSYTDDAIVTSSPTGRHLSTVIRRPCVLMSGWDEHAEAICKVLNELDRKAKAGSLSLHMQTCGRVKRQQPSVLEQVYAEAGQDWPTEDATGDPNDFGSLGKSPLSFGAVDRLSTDWPKMRYSRSAESIIETLEKELAAANEKLAAAEGLRHVKVDTATLTVLATSRGGTCVHFKDQKVTLESV